MAWTFPVWTRRYPYENKRADVGDVKDMAAKFGTQLEALKNAVETGALGGAGSATVADQGNGTQIITFSSSSASVSDNGDGTQTITL